MTNWLTDWLTDWQTDRQGSSGWCCCLARVAGDGHSEHVNAGHDGRVLRLAVPGQQVLHILFTILVFFFYTQIFKNLFWNLSSSSKLERNERKVLSVLTGFIRQLRLTVWEVTSPAGPHYSWAVGHLRRWAADGRWGQQPGHLQQPATLLQLRQSGDGPTRLHISPLLGNKFYTHKFFALFTVGSVHFSVYNS